MAFEDNIGPAIVSRSSDKTFLDKVLAKQDIDDTTLIIKKNKMIREDIMGLINQCSSSESKLFNYTSDERFIMARFFVWIDEFAVALQILHDYEEDIIAQESEPDSDLTRSETFKQLMTNCKRSMEHDIKFLVDTYFQLARTSLSLGATGFMESLTNRFDIGYNASAPPQVQQVPQNRRGIFGN